MEQPSQKPFKSRRSKSQIQELLHEFEHSTLSPKDFCKKHSLNIGSFRKWKSRYGVKQFSKKNSSGFSTLDVISSNQQSSLSLFAVVDQVKLYQPVSASFIKELLK